MVRGGAKGFGAKGFGAGLKGSGRGRPTPHLRGAYRPRSLDGPPFVRFFLPMPVTMYTLCMYLWKIKLLTYLHIYLVFAIFRSATVV